MKEPLALRRWIFAAEVDGEGDDFLNSAGEPVSEEAARFDPFIGDAYSAQLELRHRTDMFEHATGRPAKTMPIPLGKVQEGAQP